MTSTRFLTKTLIAPGLLSATLLGCGTITVQQNEYGDPVATADVPYVAVTQIVEHPALDAVRDGLQDKLKEEGYDEADSSLKWAWESAQGQASNAAQIAQKFVGDSPNVIVAIATPSAQAVVGNTDTIPVVFSAVTDPVAAELVPSLEASGGTVTGVSDLSPVDEHLALIADMVPGAKSVGVIYNAGESNSVSLVNVLNTEADEQGFTVEAATVSSSADVATAAESLVGKVDAIYIPTDNTVVSALESVIQVGNDNQLPVFAGDTDSVERGAIATASFDYYEVGRQTGDMVARILGGESPGDIPVELANTIDLAINLAAAEAMGVTVSDAIKDSANQVFE
ncbi:ABC transporter substrate-binding protein [Leptolyngbyaceae cyanobacterium CCMR0082]|uniref:ABC transporter substrate-binding protein n=1 Tax=Adonisia turfae CCMR0082 TaxID=2304604 RepID=A0A6M0SIC1_9CYAN|nr:ABC transporter substrate-binding protein [Adonisia turfae]MDV3348043.1 ABC transporter substrate-binding protein [Leptothoe sp. LEGE 181152]NEZ68195.1 ABC transporter substrate-binding protein [Adonisia turfae CCMR0082]